MITSLWLPEGRPRREQVDVAVVCRNVLAGWESRRGVGRVRPEEERDDLLQHLFMEAWRAVGRFDATRNDLEPFLYRVLYHKPDDWLRKYHGRTRWQFRDSIYEREPERPLSLDAPWGDDGDGDARSLGDLVASSDRADEADRHEVLEWLDNTRDRACARDGRVLTDWYHQRMADRARTELGEEEQAA